MTKETKDAIAEAIIILLFIIWLPMNIISFLTVLRLTYSCGPAAIIAAYSNYLVLNVILIVERIFSPGILSSGKPNKAVLPIVTIFNIAFYVFYVSRIIT